MARVEPRTFSFEDLIEQVKHGVLRVPRFQRGFVWRRDQVLALFDSIRKRYPIGSLLIWRTKERYNSFETLGPIHVGSDQPAAPAEVGYVLDGHQRLSTLFGVFAVTDQEASDLHGNDRLFLVYYDPDTDEFLHPRYPATHQVPVRYLLGADDTLTKWIDERRDQTQPGTKDREEWDIRRRRTRQLQGTFAQYKLPYLDVTDASLDEAVNIFCQLNSQATPVKRAEVFAALTWTRDGFDFAGAALEVLQQSPKYANFGTEPLLRALLAALGESVYAEDWDAVQARHRSRLSDTLQDVGRGFELATQFLDMQLGASSGTVVPYSLHLVVLTEFFRCATKPTPEAERALLEWLWASALSGAYTGGSNLAANQAVERARRLAHGEVLAILDGRQRLKPFPRKFHPKSARVRVFHLFLKQQRPRDLRLGKELPSSLLSNGMADARAVSATGGRHSWLLASRLLVGTGRGSLLDQLKAFSNPVGRPPSNHYPEQTLASHCIPREALDALLAGDEDRFLALRENELIRAERAFASRYVDIPPAGEDSREEEPEIDVIEEPESDLL